MEKRSGISRETLQNIYKRNDILLCDFIEIAKTAGYEVLPEWDKTNQCPLLKENAQQH